jgi:hypothetical protein
MNITENIDDEFSRFFESLGYQISWDFDRRSRWYEILDPDTGKLLCQVDIGTPVSDFLEDLEQFVCGKDGTSSHDYVCNFVSDDAMNAIYQRVTSK